MDWKELIILVVFAGCNCNENEPTTDIVSNPDSKITNPQIEQIDTNKFSIINLDTPISDKKPFYISKENLTTLKNGMPGFRESAFYINQLGDTARINFTKKFQHPQTSKYLFAPISVPHTIFGSIDLYIGDLKNDFFEIAICDKVKMGYHVFKVPIKNSKSDPESYNYIREYNSCGLIDLEVSKLLLDKRNKTLRLNFWKRSENWSHGSTFEEELCGLISLVLFLNNKGGIWGFNIFSGEVMNAETYVFAGIATADSEK